MTENRVRATVEAAFGDGGFRHVEIDDAAVDALAETLAADGDLPLAEYRDPPYPPEGWDEETVFDLFALFAANGFQFVMSDADERYRATYGGETYEGMYAMVASLVEAVADGVPVTDGDHLRGTSLSDTRALFAGEADDDTEIPMLEARHELHVAIGETLCEEYDGNFHDLLAGPTHPLFDGGDGVVERLIADFPAAFDDTRTVDGRTVAFDKKAQLVAAYAYGRFQDEAFFSPPDADRLTLLGDYVVPANLRAEGVLVYDDDLARRVDSATELPEGSREEVEIRAATVLAGDRLVAAVGDRRGSRPLAQQVDYELWKLGRDLDLPFHVTHTTSY